MSGTFDAESVPEASYSVSRLCGEIREVVSGTFPRVWVVGEVQRLKASRAGHLYFELIEKGDDDEIVGKLDVAVWRTYNRQVQARLRRAGAELEEGREIRCLGRIDFYEAGGRLQLIVSDIDPTFTLGRLEQRRRETLAALERAGLMDRNRRLELPPVPLRLALVTSEESAAYHDFLSSLSESPYGFRVTFVHAAVQGADAELALAGALRAASALDVDLIALVRGGGSRTDLAVFDSRRVAEGVARASRPVLTGLGHETDQSVTDLLAHTALKTPTKVAEHLIERVATAEGRLDRLGVELRHRARAHLAAAGEALRRAESSMGRVTARLSAARRRWEYLANGLGRAAAAAVDRGRRERSLLAARLAAAAPRYLERRRDLPARSFDRLSAAARRRLRVERDRVEARRRLCEGLSPQRLLRRGFSITRDGSGRILKRAADAPVGRRITTRLAEGEIASRVEEA